MELMQLEMFVAVVEEGTFDALRNASYGRSQL
jgi:hypothetical protein